MQRSFRREDAFKHCLRATGPEEPGAPPPMPEEYDAPPPHPRATGGLHTFAIVLGVLMLIFDGFMALTIVSTVTGLLQFNADPQVVIKAMPPDYPLPPLPWLRQYLPPMMGLLLINQFGSLLLVFGVIGFLQRKRWCVHPLFLGFGINLVSLIVLSAALGPMVSSLPPVPGETMTPGEQSIGLVMALIFIWSLFGLFRGIPALVLRASIRARWEEEFV